MPESYNPREMEIDESKMRPTRMVSEASELAHKVKDWA